MSEPLPLDAYLLPPPMNALAAALLLGGAVGIARRVRARWLRDPSDHLTVAASIVLVLACTAALVLTVFWVGWMAVGICRALALGFGAIAWIEGARALRGARGIRARAAARWRELSPRERLAVGLSVGIVSVLGLLAVAPVTDPDSTDYHLAVPLYWLRHGALALERYWLTMRLTGLGEMLNLLGLCAGTDCFGAVLQFAGVPIALMATLRCAGDRSRGVVGLLLVAALPTAFNLIPTEKPQFLPATAIFLAGAMVAKERIRHGSDLVLVAAAIGFAAGSKHSFALTIAPVLALLVWQARSAGVLRRALAVSALTALVIVGPLVCWRLAAFGDPWPPLLERMKPNPDPLIVAWTKDVSGYESDRSALGLLRLPVRLLLPANPAMMQLTLGVGAFAGVLAVPTGRGVARRLALLALAGAVLVALFAQHLARYYVESYFFGAAALLETRHERYRWLFWPLLVQGAAGLAAGALVAVALSPGALTRRLRERVLEASGYEYPFARWVDAQLAPADVVVWDSRAAVYLAHPLVPWPWDARQHVLDAPELVRLASAKLREECRRAGATAFATHLPADATPALQGCITEEVAPGNKFSWASRNPFWKPPGTYEAHLFRLDFTRPGCPTP